MNLAFFGGSFDPPHLGHDSIVKMALRELDIDKLVIMPTFISPFKSEFSAPPELRFSWACKLWGELEKVKISNFEITQNRPVPTIETVEHLREIYKIDKFYLIIGADHLATLDKWHDIDRLKTLVNFIIAQRNHISIPRELGKMDIHVDAASSRIRAQLDGSQIPLAIRDEVIKFYKRIKNAK